MERREKQENVDSFKAVVEETVRYMYPCYRLLGRSRGESINPIISDLEVRYEGSAVTELATIDYVSHVVDQQKTVDTPRGLIALTTELNRVKFYGWDSVGEMANHISHIYFQGVVNLPFLSESVYDGIEKRATEGQEATYEAKNNKGRIQPT